MFVFISYKTIKIGVTFTKCKLMITVAVKPSLFRDINNSKNGNDPITSFSLVNSVLECFVFKYSLNFSRW